SGGRYLLSRRSASRPAFPLMWETVGGSVLKGEESLQGALREVFEEIGIRLDPTSGRLLFSEVRHQYGDIKDVWLFSFEGEANLTAAPTDEVCETAWLTKEQIRVLFDGGELVRTLGYFFERDEF
ncbi:MAG: NUDIX domain-containing protein, partial [Oscillospiraceae bacterium]|nr:NUDIX domain-containing protein [Oscillospiraceae bacterium]